MNNNSFERKFVIKRNDTLPSVIVKLKTRGAMNEVSPLKLTAVTAATFSMKSECGDLLVSSQTAQVVDGDCGVIQYDWQEGDTSVAGKYEAEFELIFSGGSKLTVPRIGGINIEVFEDINEK